MKVDGNQSSQCGICSKDPENDEEQSRISRNVQLNLSSKWKFPGNMYSTAICLGNVDNDPDGDLEFVLGNIKGDIGIFKHSYSDRPWREAHELGTVTALTIGDVWRSGKNSLLCVTAEGELHIFDISQDEEAMESPQAKTSLIYPSLSLRIPVNSVRVLVADIDDDGTNEIVIARTDRVLHSFRLNSGKELQEIQRWQLSGQIGTLNMGTLLVEQFPKRCLMIAQPGGELTYLTGKSEIRTRNGTGYQTQELSPLGVSTEIVCDVGEKKHIGYITLDGSLRMEECNGQALWKIQMSHQLFSLCKCSLMVSNPEKIPEKRQIEQLISCAWDGTTFVVDENGDLLRFQFPDRVCAFMAGDYALSRGRNVPCFFYVTFFDEIHVYQNVHFSSLKNEGFLQFLRDQSETYSKLCSGCLSDKELSSSFVKSLLYHLQLYKN
jgi:KICSTOR complex protein ITFG2